MTGPLGGADPFAPVHPHYHGGSLADVLPSALAVLGGTSGAGRAARFTDPLGLTGPLTGVRRIAVLLLDGLGWYQLPVAAPYAPTLVDLAHRYGRPLTSGFPSTTPTSLVTLGTGATPGAHGVLGFRVNVPGTDRVLTHIDWPKAPVAGPGFPGGGPASPVGGHRPGATWPPTGAPESTGAPELTGVEAPTGAEVPTGAEEPTGAEVLTGAEEKPRLAAAGEDEPDPRRWQPLPTRFEQAGAAGVTTTVVSRPELARTGLSLAAYRAEAHRGAADADALATEMLAALTDGDGPTLVYGYHPDVDRYGHRHGIDSPQWRDAVAVVDRLLARLVDGLPADAALLVTADHGQLDIPAQGRLDLDTDPRLRAGTRVIAGEARVRYLHTEPGARDDVRATWSELLGPDAWVVTREEAVEAGWFGPVPEAHLPRIGDLVATCLGTNVVVASVENPIEAGLVAYHGSCTATEMTIPLLTVRSPHRR
ncbi:nucleotide pyrophosphatase/phosphodiesterase family protein [Plantactinospora sp. B24E8]|uniref:alkaline phosphatase family protein n=1 Tax=Plantactinospora sp. B24E8 TaxID=3153567 RepID=UPI00325EE3DC